MTSRQTLADPQHVADDITGDVGWTSALRRAGIAYLFSRVCVVIGAAIVAAELRADQTKLIADGPASAPWADPHYADKVIGKSAVSPILDVLTSWDGAWYNKLIKLGYPTTVRPHVTYTVADARAAFFPGYPMLVRLFDHVLPGGAVTASLLVNFVLGAIAVLLMGVLARRLFGVRVAERSMVLMAMFPGSFVLSFAYSEALLIVLAAGCLWCLLDERWIAAGLLGACATATRPNGLAVVAACAVAAALAVHQRRQWRSLAAVALSPLGFIGFQIWLGRHAHESGVWFRVQREAWSEGADFGVTALRRTTDAFLHPLTSPTDTITAVCVATLIFMAYLAWKHRLPYPLLAYCAGVVALMLSTTTVTARPRFMFTAFPLLICAAKWSDETDRDVWVYMIAACAAGLVGLTGLYGVLGAIP